jgi:hypothetical protein
MDRKVAEEAISRFDQQQFMGRTLSVSEARPREERPSGFRPGGGGGFGGPRPGGGGGFGGPRPGGGGFQSRDATGPSRNFGPPKKKTTASDKRREDKQRGPRGPIKERYTGRLGGLYDDPDDLSEPIEALEDFDNIAVSAPKSAEDELESGVEATAADGTGTDKADSKEDGDGTKAKSDGDGDK